MRHKSSREAAAIFRRAYREGDAFVSTEEMLRDLGLDRTASPRPRRTRESAEVIAAFWQRYLKD